MGNLFNDIKTAAGVFRQIRKARKAGASAAKAQPLYPLPVVRLGYWGATMEGCLFCGPRWQPLRDAFYTLEEETQHALTFTPAQLGGWVERAWFWRDLLRPALAPELYHEAMLKILRHYARCLRMKLGMQKEAAAV